MLEAMEHVPGWVELSAADCRLARHRARLCHVYSSTCAAGAPGANSFRPHLPASRYNKWYFDELYDADLRASAALAGSRLLWRVGDATLIDGVPNGLAALAAEARARR